MHLSLQGRRRVEKREQRRRELLRRKEKGRREGARDRQRQRETEREAKTQKAVIGESQTHCCVFNCVWPPNSHIGVLFSLFSC